MTKMMKPVTWSSDAFSWRLLGVLTDPASGHPGLSPKLLGSRGRALLNPRLLLASSMILFVVFLTPAPRPFLTARSMLSLFRTQQSRQRLGYPASHDSPPRDICCPMMLQRRFSTSCRCLLNLRIDQPDLFHQSFNHIDPA